MAFWPIIFFLLFVKPLPIGWCILCRRISAIQYDIRLIEKNAETFNEKGAKIIHNARILVDVGLEMIK